jgi:hypothetical protein
MSGVDQLHSIRPPSDVADAGLAEVEQHGLSVVEQSEHPQLAVRGVEVVP